VFYASEADAKKHGRKPPFQTELPPGMASEVYDSPDKIPANFCSDTTTTDATSGVSDTTMSLLSADEPMGAASTPKTPTSGGGTMKAMDQTCYYINGMIFCDP
jgi:hypothetical protein